MGLCVFLLFFFFFFYLLFSGKEEEVEDDDVDRRTGLYHFVKGKITYTL